VVKVRSVQEIYDLIKALYPLIYVVSPEEDRVERAIYEICEDRGRRFVVWSITEGFCDKEYTDGKRMFVPKTREQPVREQKQPLPTDPKHPGSGFTDAMSLMASVLSTSDYKQPLAQCMSDPVKALEVIDKHKEDAVFVLRDFHPYLTDPVIVRKLRDMCKNFSVYGASKFKKHIILLSPIFKAPLELEKDMAVVDFELPGREEIQSFLEETLGKVPMKDMVHIKTIKDPQEKERVIEAARGLTGNEIRSVFLKSLVRTRDLDIETILAEKKHIIRKSGILEFFESSEQWDDIGGLEVLKDWLKKRQLAFSKKARDFGLPIPKGILLIGVPGCGKSLTAKAVSNLWKMPLLRLDVGKVFSSLVGSSEENIRRAIRTAEAVAPCILWLDELEKGFSGTKSSGESDAGTTARVFASFITWLQEKQSPVFVIATANDVSLLPPELLRKGRFDDIFFVDLPTMEERKQIIRIHLDKLNRRRALEKKLDIDSFDTEKIASLSQGYSGAELEQAIISALYDAFDAGDDLTTERILKSKDEIIPLSVTMKETIDSMREWAKSRARWASKKENEKGEDVKLDFT
jgi:ATP-dependent 26S proteasome regulatory subunit